jgi:hypothetical protein
MDIAMRILTWIAAALPLGLALLFGLSRGFGLSLGGGTFLDYLAFIICWAWLAGTPFFAGAALVIERRNRQPYVRIVCLAALALWLAGGSYVMFATS